MSVLVTLTTGAAVVTNASSTFVPMYIVYTAATQLSALKITTLGDGVVVDLDQAGLNACARVLQKGIRTNTWLLPICTRFVPAENVTYSFTNSAAQTPVIYLLSDRKKTFDVFGNEQAPMYLTSSAATVLATSGANFTNFFRYILPNAVATDQITINYQDGFQATTNTEELAANLTRIQQVQNTSSDFVIDNSDQSISSVTFVPAAQQIVYVQKFVPVKAIISANGPTN